MCIFNPAEPHVETRNALFKQITGIPMGTSAAPTIANLTLFMAELKYVKMQASNIRHVGDKQWKLLRQLSFCNRYIDDLLNLCMDKTTFSGITLDIYSAIGLEITDETGDNPHQLDYLDMTIWYSKKKKRMVSKLYDKRTLLRKKGLILNTFSHVKSCLSTECKYELVIRQCARFMIACSEPKYFLQAAVGLRATFIDKKYNIKKVDKRLTRCMHMHRQQLRFKPNATQLKHEHEMQRKEQFISSIKSTYKKVWLDSNKSNQSNQSNQPNQPNHPIIGRRYMGNTTNHFLVQTNKNDQAWQQQPTAIRHTRNGLMYLVQRHNGTSRMGQFCQRTTATLSRIVTIKSSHHRSKSTTH